MEGSDYSKAGTSNAVHAEHATLGHPDVDIPDVTWWKHAGLRHLYFMMPILFLGASTNGYDGSLLNGLQTMTPWQDYFNNPSGSTLGLFTAIQNIGGVCALFISSYVADLFGRKKGVAIGLVILFVGTVIQVVPSVNSSMFLAGRFLVGLGSNVSQGSAPLLITELAHPQHRGKLTTMYNTIWYVGAIIAAWTVFGTIKYTSEASWRIPVAMQAAMPLIQFIGIWFLPESPRWLCSKNRHGEAFAILVKYHADGDRDDAFCAFEFHEIQETIRLERENTQNGWAMLVQTPGNRKRLLLIVLVSFFSQCSGNGLVSYYLHDILKSVGIESSYDQSMINGALTIWCFLVALGCSSFLVDILGRRLLFMIAGVGMLITFSIWTGCSAEYAQTGNQSAGSTVIAMIFLFYGVAGFAWPGLTVAYPAEILPFSIRAKGLAVTMAVTALSSVFNQYVNPIGLESLQWRFYFVYIAILVVECLCIWFLFVETKGPTLEEIAKLFDGEHANVAGNVELMLGQKARSEGP
ncbi:hypothetical protein N7532_004296 [Penicillium argentinense]|uniref:Major facilitator superfamily (MFS) profile domain-containing protein n=1 Tax=Penicillium argentinense TaxID=1131581 RepID=A0A9W9FP37_9EURO|nr:uncharacterized protein N7532_004296 [Penicillium argentinense]KAJ5103767.1 hypothetical protein N7532_004296 [Penicillium argentinense]